MSFQWNPKFLRELDAASPPPIALFILLYVLVEAIALALVLPDLPKGHITDWDSFIRSAVALPFFWWVAVSCLFYKLGYDVLATQVAEHNASRWHQITGWQHQSRSGLAVLDSVVLTPEPDLAQRMLKLEGEPPDNPGRVMTLDGIGAADGPRLHALLAALLKPLAARLGRAVKDDPLFDVVVQCDEKEVGREVQAVWSQVGLPGQPVVRWMENSRDAGFADQWFEAEAPRYWYERSRTPKYRLLLAWHLNGASAPEGEQDGPPTEPGASEAAVALLLGSPTLLHEKPELKRQAWLLRQITGEADQADRLLGLLLQAKQVPDGSIRHFWYSRLKGLAQHASQGAVRESGLKVEQHALDTAIGPQAPVARWMLQALAAKMVQFGQGAQLIALPHAQGVALNLVAKERAPVDLPWKPEYDYDSMLLPEFVGLLFTWLACIAGLPKGWNDADTLVTCLCLGAFVVMVLYRCRAKIPAVLEGIGSFFAAVIEELFFFWR